MARMVFVCLLVVAALAGCGESSGTTGTSTGGGMGGSGAAGGGGSGGSPLCDGVDILVTSDVLDEPAAWQTFPSELGASNFWLADDAIGLVWLLPSSESFAPLYMLVSYFDRETGQPIETLQQEPFPPELTGGGISLESVAGSPDGGYAALTAHSDDTLPGQVAQMLVTGTRDGSVYNVWVTPWNRLEAAVLHVGWDGEAFTVLSYDFEETRLQMVRLSVDGTVVTGPVIVGSVTSLQDGGIAFCTDPLTGITWVVSAMQDSVWLTGSHRDGTLVDWMDPVLGGVAIEPIPASASASPAARISVIADGNRVVVGWTNWSLNLKRLQEVVDGVAVGETVVQNNPNDKTAWHQALLPHDGAWWMSDYVNYDGVATYRLEEGQLDATGLLIDHDACEPNVTCLSPDHQPTLDARHLQAEGRDDDRWFGYLDRSSCFDTPDKPFFCPYRIVKVLEGCSYPTVFALANP